MYIKDPEEYGNLTVVRISSENLWTPDTFVYTTADHTGFLLPQTGAYFVVSSSGKRSRKKSHFNLLQILKTIFYVYIRKYILA